MQFPHTSPARGGAAPGGGATLGGGAAASGGRTDLDEPTTVAYRVAHWSRVYQTYLDRTAPHHAPRWAATVFLLLGFLARILSLQGWYIVAYALGIYLLNLFLAFITPKFSPSGDGADVDMMDVDDNDGGSPLPTRNDEEHRPFIRRLPEFKFWYSATRAISISIFCTFFSMFDIPVFWPILLVYWIILVVVTMKRQIKHMIKHKYVPFDWGKKRYQGVGNTRKL